MGRGLSKSLNLPFVDLDDEIEKAAGKTINEIFAAEGEDDFRKIESSLLRKHANSDRQFVMATGGGAPCFFDNLSILKESGITLYLKISAMELLKRLEKQISHRPLLKEKGKEELLRELEEKLKARSKYYENADIVIENDNASIEDLNRRILHLI